MKTRSFVLTHAEVPKSLNAGGAGSRQHWGAAHREKQRWQGVFTMLLLAERVPTHMDHCKVDVTIRWKHKNRRDSTNYIAPVIKPFADTLVRGGWLADDTDEFFELGDFRFEYPEEWVYRDPRVKGELVIALTAQYPAVQRPPQARTAARGGR